MILFYSKKITPRIEYVAKLLFEQILQVKVAFTNETEKYNNSELAKINYSEIKLQGGISLQPHPLLFEKGVRFQKPETVEFNQFRFFFKSSPDSFFPFDLFAAAFYIVTRYEEYTSTEKDHYGRFIATESILYINGMMKKPVVNLWAVMLADEISKVYPDFVWPERKFSFLSTIDVDNAWAFRHKGFTRTTGAVLKALANGKFSELTSRLAVLFRVKHDPYDNYNFIDSVFAKNEKLVRFFFLLGNYSRYDKNISFKNAFYRRLINRTNKKYTVGIHPSFAVATDKSGKILKEEKQRLERITDSTVKISRQHYLKIEFPTTFRNLLKVGIFEDYSLGYASSIGFRAGICTPFYFYDIERETTTDLLQIPFQVMDVTLQQYLRYKPDRAWDEIRSLMREVKETGGTFVSVWHNESVNDHGQWKGYREVFEKMNELGFRWTNE